MDILRPTVAAEEDAKDPNALADVMPERFSKLEKELVRGKGEMVSLSAYVWVLVSMCWGSLCTDDRWSHVGAIRVLV